MLNDPKLNILILSFQALLNLGLISALWFELKRRPAGNTAKPDAPASLDAVAIKQLEEKAIKQLEWRVAVAVRDFDASLSQTASQLNLKLSSLIANVIDREMGGYHEQLEQAREHALKNLETLQKTGEQQQQKQQAAMKAEVEAEKTRLVNKLDQKLSDVMTSYLIESLGKEIDLGSQSKYLLATLDKNKQQLKKDILGEQ